MAPAQPRPLPTFIQIVKKKAGGEAHFRLPDFSLQHCSITAHCRLQTAAGGLSALHLHR